MAVALTKFQCFAQDVGRKVHNLNTDVLKVLLTNTAPNAATQTVKTDLTEIAAGNGYVSGGATPVNSGYSQVAGVGKLVLQDVVFTAAGGSIGPFRYAVLYNSTSGTLIGYYDYGSSITLNDTETLTVDLDQAAGVLTIS